MRRRVWCAIRNRYSADGHLRPKADIKCGPTPNLPSLVLRSKRTTELTKLRIVVVEQKLGRPWEAGIPDLLFRPLERRVIGNVEVDDLPIRKLHDDEDVQGTKPDRVLYKEVAGPHPFCSSKRLSRLENLPAPGASWPCISGRSSWRGECQTSLPTPRRCDPRRTRDDPMIFAG